MTFHVDRQGRPEDRQEARDALPVQWGGGAEPGAGQADTQGWLAVTKSLSFQVLLPHDGVFPS